MPKRDGYDHGVPSWADLATTDVDVAKDFYSQIFGWGWTGRELRGRIRRASACVAPSLRWAAPGAPPLRRGYRRGPVGAGSAGRVR